MKIKQLNLQSTSFQSFHVRQDHIPQNHNTWHYHEELEFIHVFKGTGKLFVGDCIKEFSKGEVILIGSNIPHYWLFDSSSENDTENSINCIVIHFKQNCLGSDFINLPEASAYKELVAQSKRALARHTSKNSRLSLLFNQILEQEGISKITTLLEALIEFKRISPQFLVSDKYTSVNQTSDLKRMNVVLGHIQKNFSNKIELDDLAQLAQMTKNSFSRYFKQKTGKTPMQLIFELRILNACKLLSNPDYSLKEICFESGFNNFVSFHKVFKHNIKMTPNQYRNSILKNKHL